MSSNKLLKRLLTLLLFTTLLPPSLALADGGLAVRPYWTFATDAPVTHLQTGDINGDGTPEIVLLTADNWVHVLENTGNLAWRYELGTEALDLLVADLDSDGQTSEIFIGGSTYNTLLSDAQKPT